MRNKLDLFYLFAFPSIWNTYVVIFIIDTYCHMSTVSTYSVNSSVIKSIQYTSWIHREWIVYRNQRKWGLLDNRQLNALWIMTLSLSSSPKLFIKFEWIENAVWKYIKKYYFCTVHSICIFAVLIYKPFMININRIKLQMHLC